MNDTATPSLAPAAGAGAAAAARAMVYVQDADSEGVIRQVLSDLRVTDPIFKSGGLTAAIADLADRPSPRLLIVDSSGVDDPREMVAQLIERCELATGVVVIGDSNDIRLYRALNEAGAADYFFKPLVTGLVSRSCSVILDPQSGPVQGRGQPAARTGKLILVMGARGGVGATTMAVRIASGLAEHPPRPVLLVDLDLQFGDAVLQLDATPSHALREALDRAERVDDLFLERGVIHVSRHLDLLASLEPLEQDSTFTEDALLTLLETLRRRYRFVVVDLPSTHATALQRLLHLPSVLMLVSDASLSSAREIARLRKMLGTSSPDRTIMHLLNKSGAPGSLSATEFARGAGQAPDVVIPWSREIATASSLGIVAKPDCPVLDHALAPVFAHVSGETAEPDRSILSKLLG